MARINLDDEFFGDKRIGYLSQISGEPLPCTQGRLIGLYWDSVSHLSPIRSAKEIDMHAVWFNPVKGSYADLLVDALLAEKIGEDQYRIRGVEERMGWLQEKIDSASRAGKASIEGRKRDEKGRLLSNTSPTDVGPPLDKTQRPTNTTPAASNALVLAPAPVPVLAPVQKRERETLSKTQVDAMCAEWKKTLAHFGIDREITARDQSELVRAALKPNMSAQEVLDALAGKRHDTQGKDYDPAKFLNLATILDPEKIGRFINLSAQARTQERDKAVRRAAVAEALEEARKPTLPEPDHVDPAQVRALIGGVLKRVST